jgi:hypothetical protein
MQNSDIRLIVDLADSVRNAAPIQKDPEAAQLIGQLIGTQPDALYFLVQTVLVQKEALAAQQNTAGAAAFPAAPQPAVAPGPAQEQRGRWSGLFGSRQAPPAGGSDAARPAGGGSRFLKTAAAGAAGVAGGVLLAQGISGLFTPPHGESGDHADGDQDSDSDWGMDGGWDEV